MLDQYIEDLKKEAEAQERSDQMKQAFSQMSIEDLKKLAGFEKQSEAECPGGKIRSEGKGRGLGRGEKKGPMGSMGKGRGTGPIGKPPWLKKEGAPLSALPSTPEMYLTAEEASRMQATPKLKSAQVVLDKLSAKKDELSLPSLLGLPLAGAGVGAALGAPAGIYSAIRSGKPIGKALGIGAGLGAAGGGAIGAAAAGLIGIGHLLRNADPSGKTLDTVIRLAPAALATAGAVNEVGTALGNREKEKQAANPLDPEEIQESIQEASERESLPIMSRRYGMAGGALGGLGGGALGFGAGKLLGTLAKSSPMLGKIAPFAGAALGGLGGAAAGSQFGARQGAQEAAADKIVSMLRAQQAGQAGSQAGFQEGVQVGAREGFMEALRQIREAGVMREPQGETY